VGVRVGVGGLWALKWALRFVGVRVGVAGLWALEWAWDKQAWAACGRKSGRGTKFFGSIDRY